VALRSFRQDPDARMVPLPAMSGFTRLGGGGSSSGQEDGMGGADSPGGGNPLAAGGDRRLVVSQDEVEAARADSSRV
jgi:hypothetical protein